MHSPISESLTFYQNRNIFHLTQWLNELPNKQLPLIQAMHYALLSGGKRIRPALVYMVGEMLECDLSSLDTAACAMECIHSYSLVHDDLPSMDNDELRRGQPTCHIKFNEATAILAGDALQTLAFTILSEGLLAPESEIQRVPMIQALARASGISGMCLGQSLDLDAENKIITLEQLESIHQNKTGVLIKCAVQLGALSAGEKGVNIIPQLTLFADTLGLAFQVQDDILDVISDTQTLGKPQGSDQALNKNTYPSLLGLEGAKKKAQELLTESLQALEIIPYNTDQLEKFARYIVKRDY